MSGEANGRIRLSWAQIVWGVSILGAIIGSWADMRSQNALTRQELSLRTQSDEREHARIWKAIDDVQAAPAPRTNGRR